MIAYGWQRWLDETTDRHVTVGAVRSMTHGAKATFVVFCRNTCDLVDDHFVNTAMRPETFFRDCYRMRFEKVGGADSVLGLWTVLPGTDETPVESHLHIEFCPGKWAPLTDSGALPADDAPDPWGDRAFVAENGGTLGKHWRGFPDATRLGWRGPMMREEDLRHCPLVFKANCVQTEDEDGDDEMDA